MKWPRPIPQIGDASSAQQRAREPDAWAFDEQARESFYAVIEARRDVRKFRPEAIPGDVLQRVLAAAHNGPSVGHSQPWRFIVVTEAQTRDKAAWMADRSRLAQAAVMDAESGRQLLDLQLEGIRDAPTGIVVCCDRRVDAQGVLGRATFNESDMWSCACAIENLWLAARAEGLGIGWVTLFDPIELAALMGLPVGVSTLGWLCIGWPDERPPTPGLERAGWSKRLELADVVMAERWPQLDAASPISRMRAPDQQAVVAARDSADALLTPLGSLGELDRCVNKVAALGHSAMTTGTLVLAFGDHPVADLGVTAFKRSVGFDVLAAAQQGVSAGSVAAKAAGLGSEVVDCGASAGDLATTDAMDIDAAHELVELGCVIGARNALVGMVALGEIGMGNTTVASLLTAKLLGLPPEFVVGLGAGANSEMIDRKVEIVGAALARIEGEALDAIGLIASIGGPEFALLTGVILGAAHAGQIVILDGLATSVCALLAAQIEPSITAHLIAGQRSRERAHAAVLAQLGLEPLLDIRLRAGEGVGACLASGLVLSALRMRREVAAVADGAVADAAVADAAVADAAEA